MFVISILRSMIMKHSGIAFCIKMLLALINMSESLLCRTTFLLSQKDSKDQESIQSSTIPVPGYQKGK